MADVLESDKSLRYFRGCIERYGLIPLLGCTCGCSIKGPAAANVPRHFQLLGMQNARSEQMYGCRGMVDMRYRKGNSSARPYWMMLDVLVENLDDPTSFALVFHDEIVHVHGRNLASLVRQVMAESETVTIAEHNPEKDGEPIDGAPFVESIRSYGKRSVAAKPY